MLEIGDKVMAIMPNGEKEYGVIIKENGILCLNEGNGNIYSIDGGFIEGTVFRPWDGIKPTENK